MSNSGQLEFPVHAHNRRFRGLALAYILSIGAHLVQFWKSLGLDAKSLIFREMPVKHIHFDRGHPVQVSFDYFRRLPMSAASMSIPRQRKRGLSRMETAGTMNLLPVLEMS